MIRFTLPEEPIGKGRHRSGQGRNYTPKRTVDYERRVKAACADVMRRGGIGIIEGAVAMTVVAYFAIPASAPKKKQAAMRAGLIRPTKKPDASNTVKAVEDGLNKTAYVDDVQIVELTVVKFYSDTPRVEVEVRAIYPAPGESTDEAVLVSAQRTPLDAAERPLAHPGLDPSLVGDPQAG